ncbi:hypothetical protein CIL05_05465 [Virgibacillus profundi]|uniref:VWFA domain-containing protein n=1 Tax=Virgibacillus profundi TaxID=2024555 RepID=A0A2A2IFK2_9BACI|nr:VWA domain-containing protein [Virgibacillus profundi]PAV30549.1 hypothetical protein CIL05_05465 [Virgibacillus profundi]PXY54721.1 VWA domain-containing protein [Virgibacillus profundi]
MKRAIILLLSMLVFAAGCGEEEAAETSKEEPVEKEEVQEKDEKQEKTETDWWKKEVESYQLANLPRELVDLEKELVIKEGMYSGNSYDVSAAKDKLNEMPTDAEEAELESAILQLIREDYHQEVETFVTFDPTVQINQDSPNEEVDKPTTETAMSTTHFAILLDASGSMNAISDGTSRMELAKEAIGDFIKILPENSTVSLRVYGHEGTGTDEDKEKSCKSTETLYNGEMNQGKISKALDGVSPAGWTPIANALKESEKDIPENASNAIVYVVSDGIETCDGDPVAEAEKLNKQGVQPIINIIGFQVDDEAQKLLKKVAEAGRGEFTYAGNKQDLDEYWQEEYNRMQTAWEEWQQEGMKKADEISEQLMEQAEETGRSIMDKSDQEFEREEELINYLTNEREMENADNLWSKFYERSTTIWSYGYDNQTKNWGEAYENGNDAWRYFYETGNEKWTEFYNKMN